jgi:hypothetical protein
MPAPKGHAPYPGCETGGRPKKYTKEFIEREADAFRDWMDDPKSIWYEQFAVKRGYDPNLLTIWAKENEKFSGIYKISQAWQKNKLIIGGLLSNFNSAIVKLVLANTIGWTDKQAISGDASSPLACIYMQIDGKTKDLVNRNDG